MSLPATDHAYLTDAKPDQLAALILELASQLHVERQRRIAIETALTRAGVIAPETLDNLADDRPVRDAGQAALDIAMRRLMRIMTETGGPRGPLREESLADR